MRNELRENNDSIFMSHRIRTVSSDCKFPCLLPVDDHVPLGPNVASLLEMIAEVNAEESFKLNLTFGFLLQHKETGNYRYFAPHSSNFYFKTPHPISKPSDCQGVFSELDEEHLKSHILLQCPDTKWRAVMITNIHIYFYHLGFPMGLGCLSALVKNSHVIISLERNSSTGEVYEDMDCALRALAYHRGGVTGLEVRKNELKG